MSEPSVKPAHQNPALPDFWDHRYRSGVTPWDAGQVPDDLRRHADTLPPHQRVLIPGCGTGYEARYLAEAGHEVVALDFSAAALDAARAVLGPRQACAIQGDFFNWAFGSPFDVVYERAFLCALPRRLWPGYAPRMTQLVRPGGLLAGLFFFGDEPRGPPFAIHPDELTALLSEDFTLIEDRVATASIAVFSDRERWQVWLRKED